MTREYHVTVRVAEADMPGPVAGIPAKVLASYEILWVEEIVPTGREEEEGEGPTDRQLAADQLRLWRRDEERRGVRAKASQEIADEVEQ